MPSRWREDVCLHVSYQVACNLPVSMSVEQKKLDVMVQFLLGKPPRFWADLFYPPFLLCVFRANGNMFLFKPLTVSCRVPLSRWAVQSCSAASVNNCFDLHPWSCLPVSPCWVSDGLLLSLFWQWCISAGILGLNQKWPQIDLLFCIILFNTAFNAQAHKPKINLL